jgi:peptide chain release factor subunit 1
MHIDNELKVLLLRPEREIDSVLTVYLDVDQSKQPNLNRGFEVRLKNFLANLRDSLPDAGQVERFARIAQRVQDYVSAYEVSGRSLVVVADDIDSFLWARDLHVPVETAVFWDRAPNMEQLLRFADEFQHYGVILADKATVRLFNVFLGMAEEGPISRIGHRDVRHIRTTGTDHWGSASHIQRKADEHVTHLLKRAIPTLEKMVRTEHIHRLVLAGSREVTAELRQLMPKRLEQLVVGFAPLNVSASPEDVLAATREIFEKVERENEQKLVEKLITSARKAGPVLTGIGPVLKAVNNRRAHLLVYADELKAPGWECRHCNAIFSIEHERCMYCDGPVAPIPNLLERTVEHVLQSGGAVEAVHGEPAEDLINAGGIGVFLKTRTASAQPA